MLAIASLVFAIVPVLLYLWSIWLMDRYDREPISLLLANFAWGALGAIFFGILFSVFLSLSLGVSETLDVILIAPVSEEIMKGVFLLWTVRDRRFDNITDGVVYGMAIGLGFGMTENFLYFLGATTPEEWVFLVVVRTIYTVIMHAMATGILGAFFGLTKFGSPSTRWPLRLLGLVLAIFIHFFWNFSVSINNPAAAGLGMVFIFLGLIVIMGVMQLALLAENRLIIRELTEEAELGLIPATHMQYLPYTSKRKLLGWISPVVDRKRYIQLSTRLAFRKFQSRNCRPVDRAFYLEEIEQLRADIDDVLRDERESDAAQLH
ncbi:MAG: PrsW family intramembrane metalloprotease [Bacteroidetes bacterium]|nr:PrsW family intramembrane metalloprotease [Bacteroidota bacterium]